MTSHNFLFKFPDCIFIFFALPDCSNSKRSCGISRAWLSTATQQSKPATLAATAKGAIFFSQTVKSTLWQADYSALWQILTTQTGSIQNGPTQVAKTIPVSKSTPKQQRQWKSWPKLHRIQRYHFTTVVVDPVPIRDSELDQDIINALLYFLIPNEVQMEPDSSTAC